MKNFKITIFFLLLTFSLSAQIQVEVEGDLLVKGQLNLQSPSGGLGSMYIGPSSGAQNTTGQANIFIGHVSGFRNTTGSFNTFLGFFSGSRNTTGIDNTFIGYTAGDDNRTGHSNTFVGSEAGTSNTIGFNNTFLGKDAGNKNTTASSNTFVGRSAGFQNTTGSSNTFLGLLAGSANTTGISNTFLGRSAGDFNTSGHSSVFVGRSAGLDNTSGHSNVFVGMDAGNNNTTGDFNTFVGKSAGRINRTGNNLEAFGAFVTGSLTNNGGLENAFAFGNHAIMTDSHTGVVGNIATQEIGGYVNWGTASDGRMKKNVREDVKGLNFILALRPISYQIDAQKLDNSLRPEIEHQSNARLDEISKADIKQRKAALKIYQGYLKEKSKIRYTGFIAQEVEKATESADFIFSGLVKPSHEKDHYSLRYAEFVVPLVKAIQEQQEIIEEQEKVDNQQKETIEDLESKVEQLITLVEQLIATSKNPTKGQELILEKKALLEQNQPNPFHQNTIVEYFIPTNVKKAYIQVTAVDGKILGKVQIQKMGAGNVSIQTQSYPAGNYFYSLVLDGQIFETKRMVLTR